MPLEIERRFLVIGNGWQAHVAWVAELRQGYLYSREDGLTARVRLQQQSTQADQAWLTVKAPPAPDAPAMTRLEFEYPIPLEDAHAMLMLASCRVEKRRYGLHLPDGDWVLDCFDGENAPLVIAEVELLNPEAEVAIPPWCVKEITGFHGLSNAALARNPWQLWDPKDREALWGDCVPPGPVR